MEKFGLIDILGWIGGIEILVAYWLISTKRVVESSLIYHLLNLSGAILLGIHTITHGAYPATFLNFSWAVVAGYSIWKYWIKNNSKN